MLSTLTFAILCDGLSHDELVGSMVQANLNFINV